MSKLAYHSIKYSTDISVDVVGDYLKMTGAKKNVELKLNVL